MPFLSILDRGQSFFESLIKLAPSRVLGFEWAGAVLGQEVCRVKQHDLLAWQELQSSNTLATLEQWLNKWCADRIDSVPLERRMEFVCGFRERAKANPVA